MGRHKKSGSHLILNSVLWVSLLTFCLETQTRNSKRKRATTRKRRKLKKLLCDGNELKPQDLTIFHWWMKVQQWWRGTVSSNFFYENPFQFVSVQNEDTTRKALESTEMAETSRNTPVFKTVRINPVSVPVQAPARKIPAVPAGTVRNWHPWFQ